MGISNELWFQGATKGDVAGVAINLAVAINGIMACLTALEAQQKLPQESINSLERAAEAMSKTFDVLSGWHNEAPDGR